MTENDSTKQTTFILRGYQSNAVSEGIRTLQNGERNLLVLPTGAGKSLVIAEIARQMEGNTIVFQPSKELLEQNLEKIQSFGFTDVGVFSASKGQKDFGKVTFATIGSIYNKPEYWSQFDHVIVDEAHGCDAKGGRYKEFIEEHGGSVVGLTATPWRMHQFRDQHDEKCVVPKMLTRTRPKIFDKITHVTQISDLYEQGYLCPIEYYTNEKYDISQIKLNSTGADFDERALKTYNENLSLPDLICEGMNDIKAKHVLVFVKFVEEAQNLVSILNLEGVNASVVTGEMKKDEREKVLNDFKNGDIRVVVNVGVLTTGFDFPALDCVVLARPTQSVSLYYQMIGRGIRPAPGKEKVTVIDVCNNMSKFGPIESFHIDNQKYARLHGETGPITGVDVVSGRDFEVRTKPKEAPQDDVMPFGKYKGTKLADLPSGYLEWCIKNFEASPLRDRMKEIYGEKETS